MMIKLSIASLAIRIDICYSYRVNHHHLIELVVILMKMLNYPCFQPIKYNF